MRHLFLYESFSTTIGLEELPEDLEMLLFQLFEDEGMELPERFPVEEVALDRFPDAPFNPGDRGEDYAEQMVDAAALPPILIAGNNWIDGRHRVWAAKRRGDATIQAINLESFGIQYHYWRLASSAT